MVGAVSVYSRSHWHLSALFNQPLSWGVMCTHSCGAYAESTASPQNLFGSSAILAMVPLFRYFLGWLVGIAARQDIVLENLFASNSWRSMQNVPVHG